MPLYEDLIGKPFADLGRGPDAYDCWGLVIEVGQRMGIEVPDYGVSHQNEARVNGTFRAHATDYERVNQPKVGDIAVWKSMAGELHFGIVIDGNHVLHAGPEVGVRKNRLDHPIVSQLIEGFYRCKT